VFPVKKDDSAAPRAKVNLERRWWRIGETCAGSQPGAGHTSGSGGWNPRPAAPAKAHALQVQMGRDGERPRRGVEL